MRTSTVISPLLISAFVSLALSKSHDGPRRLARRTIDYTENYGNGDIYGIGPQKGSSSGSDGGKGTGTGTQTGTGSGGGKDTGKNGDDSTTTTPGKSGSKSDAETPGKKEDGGKTGSGDGGSGSGDKDKSGDDNGNGHKEDGEGVKPPKKCKAKNQGGQGSGSGSGAGNGTGSGNGNGGSTGSNGSGSTTSPQSGSHFTVGDVKCDDANSHCVFMHDKCYTTGSDAVDGVYPPVMCSKQDEAGNGVGKCVFPDNTSTTVTCPGNESIHLTFTHEHSWYEEMQWKGYAIWSSEKSSAGFVETPSKETTKAGADCYIWAQQPKDTSKWSSGGDKGGSKSDGEKPKDHEKGDNYGKPPKKTEDGNSTPPKKEDGKETTAPPPSTGGDKGKTTDDQTPPSKNTDKGQTDEQTPPSKGQGSNSKTDGESQKGKDADKGTEKGTGSGSGSGSGSESGTGNGDNYGNGGDNYGNDDTYDQNALANGGR